VVPELHSFHKQKPTVYRKNTLRQNEDKQTL